MNSLKRYWTYYLAFILLALGLFFLNKAYGGENYHATMDVQNFYARIRINEIQAQLNREDYLVKMKHHREEGEKCFKDAKDRCWFLPNIEERKKAQYAITNAGIMIAPADPRSKFIAAVVNTLVQYGLDCNDEWHYINNKLYWAEYHFEMAEFYAHLLKTI